MAAYAENRKARFDFEILETFEAGIELLGFEVKAVRSSKISLEGAFVFPKDVTLVTRQDIEAYLEHCFYRGNVNQTRFTKLIALQKYFRYLVYDGVIKEDITAINDSNASIDIDFKLTGLLLTSDNIISNRFSNLLS